MPKTKDTKRASKKKPSQKGPKLIAIFGRCDNGTLIYKRLTRDEIKKIVDGGGKAVVEGKECLFQGAKTSLKEYANITAMSVRGVVWPITSIRGGCHPSQARKFNERMRAAGISSSEAHYSESTGDVKWESGKGGYRKWLKHTGHFNSKGYE